MLLQHCHKQLLEPQLLGCFSLEAVAGSRILTPCLPWLVREHWSGLVTVVMNARLRDRLQSLGMVVAMLQLLLLLSFLPPFVERCVREVWCA